MNQREELILKVLSSVDVIEGKTKFVKILHFTCKLFEQNQKKSPFIFKADHFGVNTQELEPLLQDMKAQGTISINKLPYSQKDTLFAINRDHVYKDKKIHEMSPKIEMLVSELNLHTDKEVIAASYYLFPETTTNSEIKPEINKKITELYSRLCLDFEEDSDVMVNVNPVSHDTRPQYPQFNDLDMRLHMMKSLGLERLPPIIPDIIDTSSGIIAKETLLLKNFNFEELLENDRRG